MSSEQPTFPWASEEDARLAAQDFRMYGNAFIRREDGKAHRVDPKKVTVREVGEHPSAAEDLDAILEQLDAIDFNRLQTAKFLAERHRSART